MNRRLFLYIASLLPFTKKASALSHPSDLKRRLMLVRVRNSVVPEDCNDIRGCLAQVSHRLIPGCEFVGYWKHHRTDFMWLKLRHPQWPPISRDEYIPLLDRING